MNDFMFHNPVRVWFGRDAVSHLGTEAAAAGTKALLMYGGGSIRKTGLYDRIAGQLREAGIPWTEYGGIEPNPKHVSVNEAAALARREKADIIIAAGGGSVIDAGKAAAALAASGGQDVWELVEARQPIRKCLPVLAVPTMAATGSEMDSSAVLSNSDRKEKKSIAGPALRPQAAFCDPSLTYSVSAFQTAIGAADIMTHTIDTKYFSRDDKMDMLWRMMDSHLSAVYRWAPEAIRTPDSYEARANLMWAASWALNSFMTCGVRQAASVHAMEHELSAVYDIPHGLGIAILLPRWMRYIMKDARTHAQIARLARNVYGIGGSMPDAEAAQAAAAETEHFLYEELGIGSRLSALGIDASHFAEMAEAACGKDGVIRGFTDLYPEDVVKIYHMCL